MSAVISLDAFRIKRGKPSLRDELEEVIARHLRNEYADRPWTAHLDAMDDARRMLDSGGSLVDAREAAERSITQRYAPSTDATRMIEEEATNAVRMVDYRMRRHRIIESQLTMAMRMIKKELAGKPLPEIFDAQERARKVLENGGTVSVAIHRALEQ